MSDDISYVIIHHTDTGSCSTVSSCSSILRGIQNWHMDNNDWVDIGYNWLIGGDGKVYAGRGWNSQGAHSPGYNSKSYGIAFIGDFVSSKPTQAAINSAKALLKCAVDTGKLSSGYVLYAHKDVRSSYRMSRHCPLRRDTDLGTLLATSLLYLSLINTICDKLNILNLDVTSSSVLFGILRNI
ncbi:peptidoglycan-recognition protein SC2-like [Glandiceps talaboti]